MDQITVLVADDHEIVRKGIIALLKQESDIEVLGEASDGQEAVNMAEDLQPDVVVMDISMPGLNGIEATRLIKKYVPATEILALSMHDDEQYVHRVLKAQALGYLIKDTAVSDLVTAIRSVSKGNPYLSPTISKVVLESFVNPSNKSDQEKQELLSNREKQVLQLIAEGYKTKQIAKRLHLAEKTVGNHRGNIMKKLDIHDVAGLTRYAILHGMVSEEGKMKIKL